MDPISNPYAPGAGTPPPELAGRDELRETVRVALARILPRPVTSLGPTRSQLIAKGMVWSPSHGDTDFTVPQFDQFMRSIMPDDDWRG